MKKLALLLGVSAFILSSCSSRITNFSAQKYTNFKKGEVSVQANPTQIENKEDVKITASIETEFETESPSMPSVIQPSKEEILFAELKADKSHFIQTWNNLDHSQKKEVVSALKTTYKAAKSDKVKANVDALELICAIFLPPLGVYLHEGVTTNFWIDLILTLLFFIPGMIFAILVVTDNIN